MNPNNNQSGFELPQPVQAPMAPSPQAPPVIGSNPAPPIAPPQASNPFTNIDIPVKPQGESTDRTGAGSNELNKSSTETDSKKKLIKDKDLIDREWVSRVKEVEKQTKDDPYDQVERIAIIKADYMKSQFNKILKTNSQ